MNISTSHRLCLAAPVFYPTYGGSLLRFKSYLPGLRERNLDLRVYTGTPHSRESTAEDKAMGWDRYPVGQFMPQTQVEGVPLHRVRLPEHKGKHRTRVFNRMLLECCRKPEYRPDVLQMVGSLKYRSIPLLQELRRMEIPVLYAVTVAPPKTAKRKWLSLSQRREIKLFNLLDCIVTNNEPLRDFVRDMGIRTRVEIIPNGVDLQRFHPAADANERQAVRDSLGISAEDTMITTVGGVMPRKGSDLLLAAWARLAADYPRVHLVFIGPRKDLEQRGLKSFAGRLETLMRQSGSPERVHFTGLCDTVPGYMRATDIFVLPSEREGMPNAVLEAMASRVPVVITPFKGLSGDLGVPGEQFLLSNRNAVDLSSTLKRLLDEPDLASALGKRGQEWITQTMNIDKSLDRYANLYHELAVARKC